MTVKILAPAKINLLLETGVSENGFHPIVSLIDIIDLCDTVEINESSKTNVVFLPPYDIPKDNTVVQSIALLKERFNLKKEFDIKILKRIPPGSGLGGGSSDAAAVLNTLSGNCNQLPTRKEIVETASIIGKDVPLFLCGRRCVVEGFGEKIRKVPSNQTLFYLLFIPNFEVSTKNVYSNLDKMGIKGNLTQARAKIKIILALVESLDVVSIEKHIDNRLSYSYFNLYPQAREVKNYIEKKTGKSFFVSGSGGTLFAVFATKREAEEKAVNIKVEGWKSFVVCSMTTSWKGGNDGNYRNKNFSCRQT